MQKNKQPKRLALQTEKVRELTTDTLAKIAGGGASSGVCDVTKSVQNCVGG